VPRASVLAAAGGAETLRPMVRRDHLAHARANAAQQTAAAEQQIGDEAKEPSIDAGLRLHRLLAETVTARE